MFTMFLGGKSASTDTSGIPVIPIPLITPLLLGKGYFGGGTNSSTGQKYAIVDAFNFSTEVSYTASGGLSLLKSYSAGVNSSTKGYFGGGTGSDQDGYLEQVDGLVFSQDTLYCSYIRLAYPGKGFSSGASSSIHGYFGGGAGFNTLIAVIEQLNFETETVGSLLATLSLARESLAGVSAYSKGYFGGGRAGSISSTIIDRLDFSTTSVTMLNSTLSQGRLNLAGVQSKSKGYFGGGLHLTGVQAPTSILSSKIDGLNFATEVAINLSAVLGTARSELAGISSRVKGYFGGGYRYYSSNEIDGISFSTEAAINPSATLSSLRSGVAGVSYVPALIIPVTTLGRGYFGGGYRETYSSLIESIEFRTETIAPCNTHLSEGRSYLVGVYSFNGYFGGGNNGGGVRNCIDGISFPTEAALNPSTTIAYRYSSAGVNSALKGYFGGGNNGLYSKEIDGIDFTTEAAINPTASLTKATMYLAGVSSSIKGYFGGGSNDPNIATLKIDALEFNSETKSSPGDTLSVARHSLTGVYSETKGYFGGGLADTTLFSTIDALTFTTESVNVISASLSKPRRNLAGVNSSFRGYFGGGSEVGTESTSKIDGISFITEVALNLSAVLAVARQSLAGVSYRQDIVFFPPITLKVSSKGYFSGGNSTDARTPSDGLGKLEDLIDGLTFITETYFILSSVLPVARFGLSGVTSYYTAKGYFGGGWTDSSTGYSSNVDGINFITETSFSTSCNIQIGRWAYQGACYGTGVNSYTIGYFVGGTFLDYHFDQPQYNGPQPSRRIDGFGFATESLVNLVYLLYPRTGLAGLSSDLKGYFVGGGRYYVDYRDTDLAVPPIPSWMTPESLEAIIFNTQTCCYLSAVLPITNQSGMAGMQSKVKGYLLGGQYSTRLDSLDFSTESYAHLSLTLSGRCYSAGVSSIVKGYSAGGLGNQLLNLVSTTGVDFSTNTSFITDTVLSLRRYHLAGTSYKG